MFTNKVIQMSKWLNLHTNFLTASWFLIWGAIYGVSTVQDIESSKSRQAWSQWYAGKSLITSYWGGRKKKPLSIAFTNFCGVKYSHYTRFQANNSLNNCFTKFLKLGIISHKPVQYISQLQDSSGWSSPSTSSCLFTGTYFRE